MIAKQSQKQPESVILEGFTSVYTSLQINPDNSLTEVLWPQRSLKIWFKHTETHSSSQNAWVKLCSELTCCLKRLNQQK